MWEKTARVTDHISYGCLWDKKISELGHLCGFHCIAISSGNVLQNHGTVYNGTGTIFKNIIKRN